MSTIITKAEIRESMFETRSAPTPLIATHRDFTFYVAHPNSLALKPLDIIPEANAPSTGVQIVLTFR
jgi:hypothetical protein